MNSSKDSPAPNLFSTREPIHFDIPDADITLYNNFFTDQESKWLFDRLVEQIDWQQYQISLFGRLLNQPRLTAYYGDQHKNYSYSGLTLRPLPWTNELLFIKNRIESKGNIRFSSVLLNYYRNGNDSMGWHSDDEKELGQNPAIGSVSFGASRRFQLRHNKRKDIAKVNIDLHNGSYLLMKGSTQHFWQHQIPKSFRLLQPRINLTFRWIE